MNLLAEASETRVNEVEVLRPLREQRREITGEMHVIAKEEMRHYRHRKSLQFEMYVQMPSAKLIRALSITKSQSLLVNLNRYW